MPSGTATSANRLSATDSMVTAVASNGPDVRAKRTPTPPTVSSGRTVGGPEAGTCRTSRVRPDGTGPLGGWIQLPSASSETVRSPPPSGNGSGRLTLIP